MAVFGCPRCRAFLTFRPPEARDREYCFPHSDDFHGCDTCGIMFCGSCGAGMAGVCPDCGGRLHADQRFPAVGVYQLPPVLRRLATKHERLAWVEQMYERGLIVSLERQELHRI